MGETTTGVRKDTVGVTGKEHGTLLTIWLALLIVGNGIVAISYIFARDMLAAAMVGVPAWAYYTLGILSILNVIFAIMVFMWNRWAFYALVASAVIAFGINLVIGMGITTSFAGLLGVAILYFLIKPKWDVFE